MFAFRSKHSHFRYLTFILLTAFVISVTLAFGHGNVCSRSRGEYDRAKKAHSDAKAEWQRAKDNQLGDVAVAAAATAATAATAAGLTALVTTAPVGGIGAVPAAGIGGVVGGISGTVGGIVVTSANIWRLGSKER